MWGMRIVLVALFAGLCLVGATSCGGDDSEGCTGMCQCTGAECVCPDQGDCAVDCIDMCDLQCAGAGNCDFQCGPMCLASCTGSGACTVSAGDESTVACPGSGGCDVTCTGDCTVQCPGSGECDVHCPQGSTCNLEQCSGAVQSCADGLNVCNGVCPP
jgi:hypothetical protein